MTEIYTNKKENKNLILILITIIVVSLLSVKIAKVALLYGIVLFFIAIFFIIKTKNSTGLAHLFAAYFMAAEVFFRMSFSGLPWEFSKYAIIIILILGLVLDNQKRNIPYSIIIYFLILLPAIFLSVDYYYNDVDLLRKRVIFNLLGPLVLFVSVIYFYRLSLSVNNFINISRAIVLGVFSMSIFTYFKIGDYTALEFTYSSNFDASGGFSGNQVSIMFGIGIMILGMNLFRNNVLFIYKFIDLFLIVLFTFQALMTFSRGGLFVGIISIIIGVFIYYFSSLGQFIVFIKNSIIKVVILILLGVSVFSVVNEITDNRLYSRYFNIADDGFALKKDYTTGRGDISKGDIDLFIESDFVGVGLGVSVLERKEYKNFAAHIEYTRLLAEHGILGLISILILFYLPFKQFINLRNQPSNNMLLVCFSSFALMTMTHAAMRVGAIGFFFGLAFIVLYSNNLEEKR